jgi:hypothetical protein
MVRLGLALAAEVFLAFTASNSVPAHMHGGVLGQKFALVILHAQVYLPLYHVHNVPAAALNQILVLRENDRAR